MVLSPLASFSQSMSPWRAMATHIRPNFPAIKSNTVAKLFSSHPKVEDRIKKLNDIQKNLDSRKFSNYEPPYKNFRQKK